MSDINLDKSFHFKSICAKIDGKDVDIVYAEHIDKILLIVTQFQKLGSLLVVSKDNIAALRGCAEESYNVNQIFGEENIEELAAARFIAEKLDIKKKLCLFIALKHYNTDFVKLVLEAVQHCINN